MRNPRNQQTGVMVQIERFLSVKRNQWLLLGALGLGSLCVVVMIGLLVLGQPGVLNGLTAAKSTPTAVPCTQPTLLLGTSRFPIQPVKRSADGAIALPPDVVGLAYQVQGVPGSPLIGLSPVQTNLALRSTLLPGDAIRVIASDCSMQDFVIQAIEPVPADPQALADSSGAGVRVYVPDSPAGAGFIVQGVPPSALVLPTAVCGGPALWINETRLSIQPVEPGADGAFPVLGDTAGVAYRYQPAEMEYVFGLSPTPENLALLRFMKAGDLVAISGPNCEQTAYTLYTVESGGTYTPARADAPAAGVVLFVQNAPAGEGLLLRGGPVQEEVISTDIPNPQERTVEANISLLETLTVPGSSAIGAHVAIENYGSVPIQVTSGDVWLVQEGSGPITLANAEPALPQTIEPGTTKEFNFTFIRPAMVPSTIKIFTVEFDLEGN